MTDDQQSCGPRLFGVGVGPGDPELLTLKAARVLRAADVIFAPTRRPGGRSMALAVVRDHVDEKRQQVVTVPFPEGRGVAGWSVVARQILDTLRPARQGVFLTEGDPVLFGSFAHVAAALRTLSPGLPVEIVPGVTSVTAAAAAAGVALTDYEDRLAVVPGTADLSAVEQTLRTFDCVVLLKVGGALGELLALLERLRLTESAVYVRRCGWPDQQIVHDVGSLQASPPADYFALLIVRRR